MNSKRNSHNRRQHASRFRRSLAAGAKRTEVARVSQSCGELFSHRCMQTT